MIADIFSVKYYKVSYPGSLTSVTEYAKNILYENWQQGLELTHPVFDGNSVSTVIRPDEKSNLNTDPKFATITRWILQQSSKFAKELGYGKTFQNSVVKMWVNSYEQAGSIKKHTHSPAIMSGVFNLQKQPGQSNLVFNHPLNTLLTYQPYRFIYDTDLEPHETVPHIKWFTHEVDSQTGDLVLWPAWLEHHTDPNQITTPKIAIGIEIY